MDAVGAVVYCRVGDEYLPVGRRARPAADFHRRVQADDIRGEDVDPAVVPRDGHAHAVVLVPRKPDDPASEDAYLATPGHFEARPGDAPHDALDQGRRVSHPAREDTAAHADIPAGEQQVGEERPLHATETRDGSDPGVLALPGGGDAQVAHGRLAAGTSFLPRQTVLRPRVQQHRTETVSREVQAVRRSNGDGLGEPVGAGGEMHPAPLGLHGGIHRCLNRFRIIGDAVPPRAKLPHGEHRRDGGRNLRAEGRHPRQSCRARRKHRPT